MNQQAIRQHVRGVYDLQKLRIMTGNRVAAVFRSRLSLQSSQAEEEEEDAKEVLDALRVEFKRITDGIAAKGKEIVTKGKFQGTPIITTYIEYVLVAGYLDLLRREESEFRKLGEVLADIPIYAQYLSTIHGCGPAMSGVLISELDPHKARHVSSFWKYAGLDVAPCRPKEGAEPVMMGRSRKADHLVKREYIDKDGNPAVRDSVTFNPWLKTKLYVLGGVLIKLGNPKYRAIYDGYKHRLECTPRWAAESKGHRHNAAIRYMVKQFLADLWVQWRTLEGLPVSEPYAVAKLGMTPHGQERRAA